MADRLPTDGQNATPLAMPGDQMNGAKRRRPPADGGVSTTQNWDAETPTGALPIPQPHNITLQHNAGALTVDWHTAPNGYEVALVRGRNEILNQYHLNPPATLLTDAVPAGEYCITVKARLNGADADDQTDGEPCIVKLATPMQITLRYNEALRQLEVHWQPVTGAQGYRVQVVQIVAAATVPAGNGRWAWGQASAGQSAKRQLQAWVQAQGDERYYVDSNVGKSAIFEFIAAGPGWGLFDQSDFDHADFFPEADAAADGASAASADDDEGEFWTLTLLIAQKAGLGYTLDDNINPSSRGQVAEDGLLVHEVSVLAEGAVITFDDGSEAVELLFAPADDEAEPTPEAFLAKEHQLELPWVEDEEDEEDPALVAPEPEADDENTISLFIPGKENSAYTLDDHVNAPSAGRVTADGLLIHAVASTAQICTIQFQDGSGDNVEFIFAPN